MRPINGGPGIEIVTTRHAGYLLTLGRDLQRARQAMADAGDALVAMGEPTTETMNAHTEAWRLFCDCERLAGAAARRLAEAERAIPGTLAFSMAPA